MPKTVEVRYSLLMPPLEQDICTLVICALKCPVYLSCTTFLYQDQSHFKFTLPKGCKLTRSTASKYLERGANNAQSPAREYRFLDLVFRITELLLPNLGTLSWWRIVPPNCASHLLFGGTEQARDRAGGRCVKISPRGKGRRS